MEQIHSQLKELQGRFNKINDQIDWDSLNQQIQRLELEMNQAGFWDDSDNAKKVSKDLANKQKIIDSIKELDKLIISTIELAVEPIFKSELEHEIKKIQSKLDEMELKLFLSGRHDESESILSIHSGTGGTEAMDWAAMLSRMYQRYFEKMGWRFEVSDESLGDETGIKSVTFIVHESYAYGLLKREAGTHRLVRQSPFNADHLRQTSFALVEVLPIIEGDNHIQINPSEVEFEAFRSGGAGGQNVNKVSTAVRVKHLPSGIVVTCQTERSQLQNRENAMSLLRARLWEKSLQEQNQTTRSIKGEYKKASWGNQIRSYVLHPYHLVKDLRTHIETSDTEAVLGGDLGMFIEAEVRLDKTYQ